VSVAFLHDVSNACREHATHAGDLLIDSISDLMRDAAQFLFGTGKCDAVHLSFLIDIAQAVADSVLAGGLTDAAVRNVVRAAAVPVVVVDRTFGVKRRTRGIDQARLSRAGEIGANDLADELTLRVAREVGDGNRILGSTHAGDVYSQLCLGRPGGKQAQGKQQPE